MTLNPSLSHIPAIQGLRAIAVTLVVLAHAKVELFSGGFVGVDIFFVLSGYLITGVLLKEKEVTGNIQLAKFFSRRMKRLLPAVLVVVAVTAVLAKLILSNYELLEQTQSMLYAVSWLSNIFFAFSETNYFSSLRLNDLYLHTWSLGVEEQFYLIWPLVLLSGYRLIERTENGAGSPTHLLLWLIVVALSSFSLSIYWSQDHPMWSFYLMPARIWQFTLGAIVLVIEKNRFPNNRLISKICKRSTPYFSFLGLLLIFFSATFLNSSVQYPGYWSLSPSLGTFFILLGIRGSSQSYGILSHSALTWLGDRSYSLYLWHWPILMIGFSLGLGENHSAILSLILISLLLAMLSYSFIEIPFWKGRFSFFSPTTIIICSVLMITLTSAGLSIYNASGVTQNRTVLSLQVSYAVSDMPVIYDQKCDSYLESAKPKACILAGDKFGKTIVLIGDSILAQWYSLFPKIFSAPQWRIVLFTKSACPMVDEDIFYKQIGKIYDICATWRNAVLDQLSVYSPDIVVVGSSSFYKYTEEQWVEGSRRVFEKLSGLSEKTIVINGSPKLSFSGPGCLGRLYDQKDAQFSLISGSECSEPLNEKKNHYTFKLLNEAAEPFPSVQILELSDLICPEGVCRAKDSKGMIVYRDGSHLTNSFVLSLAPKVADKLRDLNIQP